MIRSEMGASTVFYNKKKLNLWTIGVVLLTTGLVTGCSENSEQDTSSSESEIKIVNPNQSDKVPEASPSEPAQAHTHTHEHAAEDNSSANRRPQEQDSTNSFSEEVTTDASIDGSYSDSQADHVTIAPKSESGYVEWSPPKEIDYQQADLVVIAPSGERIKRSFSSGEPIVLDESLPDGVYKWESVVSPKVDPYVREEMQAVRNSGNLESEEALIRRLRNEGSLPTEAQSEANRQSGTFIVRDGVAYPSLLDDPSSEENGEG